MKITYDMQEDVNRECVAYMKESMLVIKGDDEEAVMVGPFGAYVGDASFSDYMIRCDCKFYEGDSVTITF